MCEMQCWSHFFELHPVEDAGADVVGHYARVFPDPAFPVDAVQRIVDFKDLRGLRI
jgi:hypothetical protein